MKIYVMSFNLNEQFKYNSNINELLKQKYNFLYILCIGSKSSVKIDI